MRWLHRASSGTLQKGRCNINTSPRSKLQELADYWEGVADAETAARVEAELAEPDNIYVRFFRGPEERASKRVAPRDSHQEPIADGRP